MAIPPALGRAARSPGDEGGVPVGLLIALLVVCEFAPYGIFTLGGGTLRPDHLAVHLTFLFLLLKGRLLVPPVLASSLFALALIALFSTMFRVEDLLADPMSAVKFLDALVRGPEILTIAASLAGGPRAARRFNNLLVVFAVVFAAMAIADRLLEPKSTLSNWLVDMYGGPVPDEGLGARIGLNHKAIMILEQRATAVFVAAPHLGIAAVLLLALATIPGTGASGRWRAVMAVAAVVCGLLANSKSFLLGVPVSYLAAFITGRKLSTHTAPFILVAVGGALLVMQQDTSRDNVFVNPLARMEQDEEKPWLYQLSAGRYGSEEWSVLDTFVAVADDSPVVGYGLAMPQDLMAASDSGINSLLIHGGLLGLVVVFLGMWMQAGVLLRYSGVSPWAGAASVTLLLAIAFFAAAAVFMMPRVNDLLFSILGVGLAMMRWSAAALARAQPPHWETVSR